MDKLILEASAIASGPERNAAWEKAFNYLYTEVVPDTLFFHMVGYVRVNKRINFIPTIETNTSVELSRVTFN